MAKYLGQFINSAFRLSNIQCVTSNTENKHLRAHANTPTYSRNRSGQKIMSGFQPTPPLMEVGSKKQMVPLWSSIKHTHTHVYTELKDQTDGEEHSPLFPFMSLTLYRKRHKRPGDNCSKITLVL